MTETQRNARYHRIGFIETPAGRFYTSRCLRCNTIGTGGTYEQAKSWICGYAEEPWHQEPDPQEQKVP